MTSSRFVLVTLIAVSTFALGQVPGPAPAVAQTAAPAPPTAQPSVPPPPTAQPAVPKPAAPAAAPPATPAPASAPAASGSALVPLAPPPPDLTALVPFASAPLDKPPVALPEVPLPPSPARLPSLPPAAVFLPDADKPTAFVPPPRTLPCVGAWLRIASESLECGRSRFSRGEFDDAVKALEQVVKGTTDRDLLREARYWLAESLYRLGRNEPADWLFRQVAQDAPRGELAVWAVHGSGWTALRLQDVPRARDTFAQLLGGPMPAPVEVWTRHGLGLSSYALGRFEEARDAWAPLATRTLPAGLARDILFWYAETLGRTGQPERAVAELARFAQGGSHPLLPAAQVRLGWWNLQLGRTRESADAFRTYLAAPGAASPGGRTATTGERDLAEAGLAQALLTGGDIEAARAAIRALQARRSPLAVPVLVESARSLLAASRAADAQPIIQELLGGTLTPPVRAWVLLLKGDAHRTEGNRDEARTQYDLAITTDPSGPAAPHAIVRIGRTNFEMREFAQAAADAKRLVGWSGTPLSPELRAIALLLQGEAAYHAGDYRTSASAFRQALIETPASPQLAPVRLALAWTSLRQGQGDQARREFVAFADAFPKHANTPDALVLAAELALAAGDLEGARPLLDRVITAHGTHPRTEFARLNRAILMVRTGDLARAQPALREWISRAPFPPLVGRAHAAYAATLISSRPAEAARQFEMAQREGVGAFAALGLGTAALVQSQWDAAGPPLTEARDSGSGAIAGAADYALAVVAFHRGAVREFRPVAQAALKATPTGPAAPWLLYVLTGIEVHDAAWPAALATAKRLVETYPRDEAADDALERVGAGATAVKAWPVVYETYTLLRQRYPQSPFAVRAILPLAEAQLETGRGAEAKGPLEHFVQAFPSDARIGHAFMLLARAREAIGDRAGALDAYARAARDPRGAGDTTAAVRGQARLLVQERRWDQARTALEKLLRVDEGAGAAEVSRLIGETYQGQGEHLGAAEYFLTAAYLTADSPAGHRALLAAARSLAAARQPAAAATAYRKLLALSNVAPDVADAARQGLAALPK